MKIKATDLDPTDRIIVLSFDEVHTRRDISYDSTTDSIIGPHSKVEVGLARGLFQDFKIPIYYRFHRKGQGLGPDELKEIISNLQNCLNLSNFHIVVCYSMTYEIYNNEKL